ncbi:acetyl-CoA synthetase-like protein [Hymenopellis radicata]|nr:acetyl-CoA synthetase-like protein [Hymenopellis radicata]
MSSKQEWNPRCSLAEADKILCRPGSLLEVETRLIDGRVQRVWKNLWPSLRSLWLWAAKEHAHKTCIVFEGQRLSYSQTFSQSLKCAAIFRDLYGVKKGDRIAICSRNYASYFTVFWACHLLGAVSVLVNALLPLNPLKHCLALGDCKVIILDPQRADLLENSLNDVASSTGRFIVIEGHEGKGQWRGMDDLSSLMSRYNGNSDSVIIADPDVGPEDDATIIFTSGTTGLPKGVLSSQRAFLTNIFNVAASSGRDAIRRGDPFPPPPPAEGSPQRAALLSTPLFHVTATAVMLNATFLGFKIVSLRKWDGKEALRLIREENVVLLGAVPSVIRDLAEFHSPEEQTPIEVIIYGGAPVAEPLLDKARKAFTTASIGQGYGLTESNAGSVGFAGKDFESRPTSAGTALPTNDVMIVKDGVRVPSNAVGEVWLRGSNIMKGYWRDPDATDAVLTKDGWLKTGDLGYIDDEGFVYIKDRIKDIIIRGGENIPSVTVENALYKDPGVSEAAAVGVPDERLGELVTALVTVKPGYERLVTEASLLALARASLPRFAVPVMILIQKDDFEHTQSGKVMKKNLRAIAKEEWSKRRAQMHVRDTKL